MRRTMTTLCAGLCTLFIFAQTNIPTTDFIKVDQFGYLPNGAKIAVISNPQIGFNGGQNFTAGATYQVRNWQTGAVVFSGSPQVWSSGATHDQSGDKGWWFDFSTLTTSGSYYIYDSNFTFNVFSLFRYLSYNIINHNDRRSTFNSTQIFNRIHN